MTERNHLNFSGYGWKNAVYGDAKLPHLIYENTAGICPGQNALPYSGRGIGDTCIRCQSLWVSIQISAAVNIICSLYAMVSQVPGSPRGVLIKKVTTSREKAAWAVWGNPAAG